MEAKAGKTVRIFGSTKDVTRQKEAEVERKQILRNLEERVKEQECLNRIAVLCNVESSVSELLEETIRVLPEGFQYPEMVMVKITYGALTFQTDGFFKTDKLVEHQSEIYSGKLLKLKVCYKSDLNILPEEDELLITVTDTLTLGLQNRETRKKMREEDLRLKSFIDSQTNYFIRMNVAGTLTFANKKFMEDYDQFYEGSPINGDFPSITERTSRQ